MADVAPQPRQTPVVVRAGDAPQPYVVEVVLLQPLGSKQVAVQAARDAVAALLANPHLPGAPTADTPPLDEDSPRLATMAALQGRFRQLQDILNAVLANLPAEVADAVNAAVYEQGALTARLPSTPPDTPDTPWLDGGLVAVTPSS